MKRFLKTLILSCAFVFLVSVAFACNLNAPESIELSNFVSELGYGKELNIEDLKIKAIYRDETIKFFGEGDEGVEIDLGGFDNTKPGDYTITVKYQGLEKTYTVTVKEPQINGIRIDRSEIPTSIGWGEEVDLSKLKVWTTSVEGVEKPLTTEDYELEGIVNNNVSATYNLKVKFEDYEKTFSVRVNTAKQTGFRIDDSEVVKKIYSTNYNNYQIQNLKVYATFEDESEDELGSDEYSIDKSALQNTAGTYAIKVKCNDKNYDAQTFNVTVVEPISIEIDTKNAKVVFNKNDEFAIGDLKVYAVYDDETKLEIGNNIYTINKENYDKTSFGEYTIVVGFNSLETKSYKVNVVEKVDAINDTTNNTLIVFGNKTYTFSNTITKLVNNSTEEEIVPDNVHVFPKLSVGEYTLYYVNSDSINKTYGYKVVDYLTTFAVGDDYASMTSAKNSAGEEGSILLDGSSTHKVGTANAYKFDLKLTAADETKTIKADKELLNFKFYVYNEALETEDKYEEKTDVANFNEDNVSFDEKYNGKKVKVVISARYHNSYAPIEMEFEINDGYNVYDNEGLKEAFANRNITNVNIQRKIVASYSFNQLNPDVTPINYEAHSALTDETKVKYNTDGTLAYNNTGNVYLRIVEDGSQNLIVNGNYFELNARNLPFVSTNMNGTQIKYADQATFNFVGTSQENTGIPNVQIALFRIRYKNEEKGTTIENNTMKVVFNDMRIFGNTTAPAGDNSESNIAQVQKNSGGICAIRVDGVDFEINKSSIKFSGTGITMNGCGADLKVNSCTIDESWANSIYSWGASKVSMVSSKIGASGGAAIHFDDPNASDEEYYNPSFEMDSNTVIDNFVAGTEPWFVAYGLTQVSTYIKVIDDNVKTMSNSSKTIIKNVKGDNNKDSQVFNFAVFFRDTFKKEDNPNPKSKSTECSIPQESPYLALDTDLSGSGIGKITIILSTMNVS